MFYVEDTFLTIYYKTVDFKS